MPQSVYAVSAGTLTATPLELRDRYGRVAKDLRISLTDRCNLRCTYCMPAEGVDWLPKKQILTHEEIVRLARIAVEFFGVSSIRLTGGEPLLRKGLVSLVSQLYAAVNSLDGASMSTDSDSSPRCELAMTTNGLGLVHQAAALKEAGLSRVNISLDTLDAQRFALRTRRDRLADVLEGIAAAKAAGFSPIKINAVLDPDWYQEDLPELLRYCLTNDLHLRVIEPMPLGPANTWNREDAIGVQPVLDVLKNAGFSSLAQATRLSAPATLWQVPATGDTPSGDFGMIPSVTAPFCANCDRTRLTADGKIRSCLFSHEETDLLTPLRAGATDQDLAELWQTAMFNKPAGHGIDDPSFVQPTRPMSAIGG